MKQNHHRVAKSVSTSKLARFVLSWKFLKTQKFYSSNGWRPNFVTRKRTKEFSSLLTFHPASSSFTRRGLSSTRTTTPRSSNRWRWTSSAIGCGKVDKVVASNSRYLLFYSHNPLFFAHLAWKYRRCERANLFISVEAVGILDKSLALLRMSIQRNWYVSF